MLAWFSFCASAVQPVADWRGGAEECAAPQAGQAAGERVQAQVPPGVTCRRLALLPSVLLGSRALQRVAWIHHALLKFRGCAELPCLCRCQQLLAIFPNFRFLKMLSQPWDGDITVVLPVSGKEEMGKCNSHLPACTLYVPGVGIELLSPSAGEGQHSCEPTLPAWQRAKLQRPHTAPHTCCSIFREEGSAQL